MPRPLQILQIYRILRSASQAGRLNPKEFVPGEVVKTQLDPTKLAASPLRRLPIFDIKQPIQGRPRESNSNAFKEFRNREERRMQKALDSLTHGKHIFVYQHARTKQVIYSLTRHLEESNVLSQMVYHGKKTVPANVRRDMWVPYFSVHFGDPRLGLRAYQMLREFSMQRQLSPPREMITVTEEFLALKRPTDPINAEKFDEKNKHRIGQFMAKKERARVLMDQKATSVADIAAVLAIQEEEIKNGIWEKDSKTTGTATARSRRLRRLMKREAAMAEQRRAQVASLAQHLSAAGHVYEITEEACHYPQSVDQVKILWRDVHDAHYAQSWPNHVSHAELLSERSHLITSERRIEGSEYPGAQDKPKENTEQNSPAT